jgi:hypothetical protein
MFQNQIAFNPEDWFPGLHVKLADKEIAEIKQSVMCHNFNIWYISKIYLHSDFWLLELRFER